MEADLDQLAAAGPSRIVHDGLFKRVFAEPALAAAELQAVAPALASRIDWPSLTLAPTNFVNAVLQQRVGDLVFHARLEDGDEALLWFLLEHQSTESRWMSLRVHTTEGAMWQQWHAHHPEAQRLPAIVPVVVYHGPRPWRAPTELAELLSAQAALDEPFTRCRYLLDDLSVIDDEALRARRMHAVGRLALFALARALSEDFYERLARRWAAELSVALTGKFRELGRSFLLYTFSVNPHLDPDRAMKTILPVVHPEAKETIVTIADQLMQRGFEKGLAQGLEKGLDRSRAILMRQLERRFGPLPAHIAERVTRASDSDLEHWADRVLDATELDAVFAPTHAGNTPS